MPNNFLQIPGQCVEPDFGLSDKVPSQLALIHKVTTSIRVGLPRPDRARVPEWEELRVVWSVGLLSTQSTQAIV